MPAQIACPACKTLHRVPDGQLGKVLKCSRCPQTFRVGAPGGAPPAPAGTSAITPSPSPGPAPNSHKTSARQDLSLEERDAGGAEPVDAILVEEEPVEVSPRDAGGKSSQAGTSFRERLEEKTHGRPPRGGGGERGTDFRDRLDRLTGKGGRGSGASRGLTAGGAVALVLVFLLCAGVGAIGLLRIRNRAREIAAQQPVAIQEEPAPRPNPAPRPEPAPPQPPVGVVPMPVKPVPVPLPVEPPPPVEPAPPREKTVPYLRVPARRQEIRPAVLQQDRVTLPLPAPAEAVCVGGGGRFLILHLPRNKQLAIFDACAARVVKYLPLAWDRVVFAAGMEKLVIGSPDATTVQRWSLDTFEKELEEHFPVPATLEGLCMGSASAGPVLAAWKNEDARDVLFLDLETLKEYPVLREKNRYIGTTPVLSRAAPDGQGFVMRDSPGGEPHAMISLLLEGGRLRKHEDGTVPFSVGIPRESHGDVFTAAGLFTAQLKPVGPARPVSLLPAPHGGFFAQLHPVPGARTGKLTFHHGRDLEPFFQLDGVDGVMGPNVGYGQIREGPFSHDQRVHLIPDADLVVTIPDGNDRLLLHRVRFQGELEKSGKDYLLVTSRPPFEAARGAPFSYQAAARSSHKDVRFELASGPAGLSCTPEGKVTWNVPPDHPADEESVVLTVGNGKGNPVVHRFRLVVR